MLPLKPRHMLATSPETKAQLSHAFDAYGDAYYEEVSAQALRAVLERMSDSEAAKVPEEKRHIYIYIMNYYDIAHERDIHDEHE